MWKIWDKESVRHDQDTKLYNTSAVNTEYKIYSYLAQFDPKKYFLKQKWTIFSLTS